jgi:hypothetical protein
MNHETHEPRKLSGECMFRQNQPNPSNDPNGNLTQINSANYVNSVKIRNFRVLIASGALSPAASAKVDATVFRGSPYPCASASIRASGIHVIPLRTWRPLREEEGQRTFSRLFPVAVRKDFYNFIPFFSVVSNCPAQNALGQFAFIVKIISAMIYEKTGLLSRKKILA